MHSYAITRETYLRGYLGGFYRREVIANNIKEVSMNELMVLGTVILSLLGFMLAVFLTIVGLLFLSEKFLENNFRE